MRLQRGWHTTKLSSFSFNLTVKYGTHFWKIIEKRTPGDDGGATPGPAENRRILLKEFFGGKGLLWKVCLFLRRAHFYNFVSARDLCSPHSCPYLLWKSNWFLKPFIAWSMASRVTLSAIFFCHFPFCEKWSYELKTGLRLRCATFSANTFCTTFYPQCTI